MSFVGTFLRSRSRHLPRSRDRSRTRDSGTTWKGRRSARRGEEREGGCPNGIRIGMGREPCTKQPRRHPACARIATLAPWLAHGKHTVSRERKQTLRNRAAHCLDPPSRGRLRLQHRRLQRCAAPTRASRSYQVTLDLTMKRVGRISNECITTTRALRWLRLGVSPLISLDRNNLGTLTLRQSHNCTRLHTALMLLELAIVISKGFSRFY